MNCIRASSVVRLGGLGEFWLDSAEDVPTISEITRVGVIGYIFKVIFSLGSGLPGMRRGVQRLGISVPAIPSASRLCPAIG